MTIRADIITVLSGNQKEIRLAGRNAHITPGRGSSRDHSKDLQPILSTSLGNEPERAVPQGGMHPCHRSLQNYFCITN